MFKPVLTMTSLWQTLFHIPYNLIPCASVWSNSQVLCPEYYMNCALWEKTRAKSHSKRQNRNKFHPKPKTKIKPSLAKMW